MEVIESYDTNKIELLSGQRQLIGAAAEVGSKDVIDETVSIDDLREAKQRLRLLEMKIKMLENRMAKKYPEVNFLNYKNRKRILVSH